MSQVSKLDITHEDYTFALESHPWLPIYVSGNRRGILCSWKFNQEEDRSLNQFSHQADPSQADPKKACVKKLVFNAYGDKVMCNNMEGSFMVFELNSQVKRMRKIPVFQLYESVDQRVTDFDLVNGDNVICTISQKQKTVKVYDTLLPYSFAKQAQVMEFKLPASNSGGNLVLFNQRKQVIYAFNGRTGAMSELDLRMNLNLVDQCQLSQSHEVTAACLSRGNDTLVTGYKDGHVKVHQVDNLFRQSREFKGVQLREKLEVFPVDSRTKKASVQRIKVNQKTGGVFASSQLGALKLIKTSI